MKHVKNFKSFNERYFFGDDDKTSYQKNTNPITLELVKQKIKELLYGTKSNERYFFDDDKKGGKNVDKEINELAERIMTDFHDALTIIDHIHSKQFSKIENMI
jgi:hypothetical protein